jgi:hypothetical protein
MFDGDEPSVVRVPDLVHLPAADQATASPAPNSASMPERASIWTAARSSSSPFNRTELVDPGVVLISYWRPDDGQQDYNADRVWGYCGVGRV